MSGQLGKARYILIRTMRLDPVESNLEPKLFEAGHLFTATSNHWADASTATLISVANLDYEAAVTIYECPRMYLGLLRCSESLLLLPVKPVQSRLEIYHDQARFEEMSRINEDSLVLVYQRYRGIVKYKGPKDDSPSIYFTVKPLDDKCDAITCTVFDLRLLHPAGNVSSDQQYTRLPSGEESTLATCNLQCNDRIVWVTDTGPEYGYVRWIGTLNEVKGIMVGVEFDNPVGSGTGKCRDRQLFEAPVKHAALLPLGSLMLARDYLQDKDPDKRHEPPLPPKTIRKNLLRNLEPTLTTNNSDILFPDETYSESVPYANGTLIKGNHTRALEFEVGSAVAVNIRGVLYYGVVKWAGYIDNEPMLGLEMDEEHFRDGYYRNVFYFHCEPNKGLFVPPDDCAPDHRLQQMERQHATEYVLCRSEAVPGDYPPIGSCSHRHLQRLIGRFKGIQGHHNSCYLDATLFAMFSCSSVFDFILDRPRLPSDIPEYPQVVQVLKENIVNSLRKNHFVDAKQMMQFRELLDRLGSVSGLTCEEKDPEEFLNCLTQLLQVEPFLHLSSGQESYLYQLFVEKDDSIAIPTVQQLLEQSFLSSDIKLSQLPAALILQMPRFGRQFKVYSKILPSLVLDVTDVLDNSPRSCHVCGMLASVECKACFEREKSLERITFCDVCFKRTHHQNHQMEHEPNELKVCQAFTEEAAATPGTPIIPRNTMELFALVCIETSHYVCFVKCGDDPKAPWAFFDSMADRQGQSNIPEVRQFEEFYAWIHQEDLEKMPEKSLPPLAKKLLCDTYMCMYRSKTAQMY